jgi:hypothetical protein
LSTSSKSFLDDFIDGPGDGSPWPVAAAAAFVLAVHIAWLFTGGSDVFQGVFFDGDSYMHLLRVERLLETAAWFDSTIPDANAPFGASLHWTRLFDMVLLVLAAPVAPFIGFPDALFGAGMAVSPILHVLSVPALAWATVPLLGRPGAALAGALTAAQVGFMAFATAGHGDHHLLYALIAILTLGCALRGLAAPDGGPYALATGSLVALGLWVGMEMAVLMMILAFAFALPWLFGAREGARSGFLFSLGLALTLLPVIVIEKGFVGFMVVEYDRVSIIHLTMALLLVAYWAAVRVSAAPWRRAWPRLGAALAGAVVSAIVLKTLYPGIAAGALGAADPETLIYIKMVSEFDSMDGIAQFLVLGGGALFAIPWIVWRTKREWAGRDRWAWVVLCICVVFFPVFAIFWVRWSLSAGIFLAVALADLTVRVDGVLSARVAGLVRIPLKVAVIVLLLVGPAGVGLAAIMAKGGDGTISCPLREMTDILGGPRWAGRSLNILASANFGPELVYRTGHKVLATHHHRNARGILDGARILGGADEAEAWRVVQKRQVGLVLLCPGSGADGYFLWRKGEGVLYRKLLAGDLPEWLVEVDLPRDLGGTFRLFEVIRR